VGGITVKRTILPYNPKLKDHARFLRRNATLAEVLLWKQLKGRKICDCDFDRQRPIGEYIVDFYCKDLSLAIEVDGQSHNNKLEADLVRQQWLEKTGVRFLRFWDHDVKCDMESVLAKIKGWIQEHEDKPTPDPSREGSENKLASGSREGGELKLISGSPPWRG
jgi:very-short-patch-repair endonuclease